MTYQLVGSILILYLKQRNKSPEDHLEDQQQEYEFDAVGVYQDLYNFYIDFEQFNVGADGSSREAIRDGGLWKFLTVRQTYPLSNQR